MTILTRKNGSCGYPLRTNTETDRQMDRQTHRAKHTHTKRKIAWERARCETVGKQIWYESGWGM